MDSLKASDEAAAAVAVAPRVTLESLESKIAGENYFVAGDAARALNQPTTTAADCLTICVLTMRNGFTVTGESACAAPENFNAELGRKFAREQAIRKAWGFEGYALREQLAAA